MLKLSESAVALEESELLISHEVEEAYRKFWKEEPNSKIPGWKMEWRSRRGALWAEGAKEQQAEDEAVKQAAAEKDAKRQQKGAKRQKKLRDGAAAREEDKETNENKRKSTNQTAGGAAQKPKTTQTWRATKKTTGSINKKASTKAVTKAATKALTKAATKATKKAATKANEKVTEKEQIRQTADEEDIQIRKETVQQTQPKELGSWCTNAAVRSQVTVGNSCMQQGAQREAHKYNILCAKPQN